MEEQQVEQLTHREQKELNRQERKEREVSIERWRKIKKALKWTIGVAVALGAIYGIAALGRLGGAEREPLGQSFPSQGQAHIAAGAEHQEYNSNPPTSGWHYAQSANWGVYQNELPDEQVLHNLEHGGVWISYKDIDKGTLSKIEGIAKQYPNKLIVTPRAKNGSAIALASWGRLLELGSFDEQLITDFIKSNKNKSPEPSAQ